MPFEVGDPSSLAVDEGNLDATLTLDATLVNEEDEDQRLNGNNKSYKSSRANSIGSTG